MSNTKKPEGFDDLPEEKKPQRDYEADLHQLQEEYEALEHEFNEANRRLEAAQEEEDADAIALQFLENNCTKYSIGRKVQENAIIVEGTLRGEQCGYVTQYVPRVFRRNGQAPYLIHEQDTFKCYRCVDFKYTAIGESLAQAVECVIAMYCPGDVEVGRQAFEDDRLAQYGNKSGDHLEVWVQCSEEPLEDFQKLPEVGENPDLKNPNVLHRKVPGR